MPQPIPSPVQVSTCDMQDKWWWDAVIYQIYPASFADSSGDGSGDLPGIIGRLDHLVRLGVDALWLSPFYVSPWVDHGYDVADYRDVDPRFGTLADFDELVAAAHAAGIRVIIDIVANHTSSQHPWFRDALAAGPGSPERARYIFRDGKGPTGEERPNNWLATRGNPAWTRTDDGQWYLHMFDTAQPDLNWRHPEVIAEFESILRFWLDRGVDGFRVDVASGMIKREGLPDWEFTPTVYFADTSASPMWDQDEVHEIFRGWHRVLAEYGADRILVGEAHVGPFERLARYVREDEMQQTFNFALMSSPYEPKTIRARIDGPLAANAAVRATTTWVLSNHDAMRHVSRFGWADFSARPRQMGPADPRPDYALGLRRARALSQLMLALPGSAYLYQGEELGLPDNFDIPAHARQDPAFFVNEGRIFGRDGCRVPLPWESDAPAFGFNNTGLTWLPQPQEWASLAVDRQEGVLDSTLELYKTAIRLRGAHALGSGDLRWVESSPQALVFDNRDIRVVMNFGPDPIVLDKGATVLLASDSRAVKEGELAADSTVWLSLDRLGEEDRR